MTVQYLNAKRLLGFSLIELIILIASIGILSSMAIPAYYAHINRSQITELMAAAVDAKTAVEDWASQSRATSFDTLLAASAYPRHTWPLSGNTVTQLAGGVIQVVPGTTNPLAKLTSPFPGISLIPSFSNNAIVWQCTPTIATKTGSASADNKALAPADCQS